MKENHIKYCIVGAGGTGGSIAAYLAKACKDVTLIARGEHLTAMKNGMRFIQGGKEETVDVRVCSFDTYRAEEKPADILFLCCKSYSVKDLARDIESVSDENTLIIPILNGIKMGDMVRQYIENRNVLDGCIYIVAEKKGPGEIVMKGDLIRVIFGEENGENLFGDRLDHLAEDMKKAGIGAVHSDNILRDTIRKFSLVSAMAGVGLYYNVPIRPVQQEGPEREFFKEMVKEIIELAEKLDVVFDLDLLTKNLEIVDHVQPDSDTSLQRDICAGGQSEIDVQIFSPLRLGKDRGLSMENYEKVAEKFSNLR